MQRTFSAVVATFAFLSFASPTIAQDYPARPIRMVVPFSPGGGSDISGRVLADGLSDALGETIVVDNRPGAGSILGCDIVAKANPDGYTTLLGNISMAFNTALYRKMPFDALRDFSPITLATDQPNILVAHPSLPAKSLGEFLKLAAAQPGKLTFGSAGLGSGTHLAMEMLLLSRKVDVVHVPYKGTGPALTALLGNQISVFFSTYASALPHVKADRLQAFAVTSAKRTTTLPAVPTVAESGFPGYEYSTWYGFLAPAGTPPAIVAKLNKAAVGVLKSETTRGRYERQGMSTIPSTSAEYRAHLKSEIQKWTKVVRAAKIPQQ